MWLIYTIIYGETHNTTVWIYEEPLISNHLKIVNEKYNGLLKSKNQYFLMNLLDFIRIA